MSISIVINIFIKVITITKGPQLSEFKRLSDRIDDITTDRVPESLAADMTVEPERLDKMFIKYEYE